MAGYNQTMLWRSARKTLTVRQTLVASEHYDRLLKRWAGNLNPSRCARLWANARCLALHPERFTFNSNQTLKNFRLERLLRWTGILLAAACTWTGRYYINADVISYLDVADAYLRSDWQHAINGHWSPLYSWILATILWIFRPSPALELPLVHAANFLIFLVTLSCFEYFWRAMVRERGPVATSDQTVVVPLPNWAWTAFGYVLFWHVSLNLLNMRVSSGDLLMSAMVYLAAGAIVRINAGRAKWVTFVVLGIALGFGYLAKAFMFPLDFVFLGTAFIAALRRRSASRILLSFLVFAAISAPFIQVLSASKGRLTFSEAGRYNYLVFVNGAPHEFWEGVPAGTGAPTHPPHKIWDAPPTYEFGTGVGGSYPLWFDESYWYDGMHPHFEWRGQLHAVFNSAKVLSKLLIYQSSLITGTLALALLYEFRRTAKGFGEGWCLMVLALAGLAGYSLVHVEYRYIAAFVLLFWLALLGGLRVPASPAADQSVSRICLATLIVFVGSVFLWTGYLLADNSFTMTKAQFQVAAGLQQLGIENGTKVAVVGQVGGSYWARIDKLTIVAEVVPTGTAEFWGSDPGTRLQILHKIQNTGAEVVISADPPRNALTPEWRQICDTNYYAYRFVW